MPGVSYGKDKKAKPVEVDLKSPTGARITVSKERAERLLARAPITLPDGTAQGYEIDDGEDDDTPPASAASGGRSERV